MSKTLGLDLGTNSIGWAVVDEENEEILSSGVRIFPEGVLKKTIGKGDKEVSRNAARRENRQSRRGIYRHRLRRIKLLEILIEYKMCPLAIDELNLWKKFDKRQGQSGKIFPHSSEFILWLKLNPYFLRDKALKENISMYEFGRILYHLIQRRGFLSNRKGNEEGKIYSGKDNMRGIDETNSQIKDSTLGSYLYTVLPEENMPFKEITDDKGKSIKVRARYTLRDMYIEEFEKIWQKQANTLGLDKINKTITKKSIISGSIFSNRNKIKIEKLQKSKGKEKIRIEGNKVYVLENVSLKEYLGGKIYYDEKEELKYKSNESVLFYQRPLKSQKGLLAKCSLEGKTIKDQKGKTKITGPTPCPLSHPEFEEFRALQYINNIEYGQGQKLDENQRKMVLDLINSKDANFDFKLIPQTLKLGYETFNYSDELKAPGNNTISKLSKLFNPKIWELKRNDIWHCFYFYTDNDKLIEKLAKDYQLEEKYFEKVKTIKLKDGYSSISLRAVRNITPFLMKGYKLSDAVILGGVRNAFIKGDYDRWENFRNEHKKIEKDIININKDKNNKEGEAIKKIQKYLIENCGFEENDKNFKKLYHHSQEIEQKELNDKLSEIENLRNPIVQQGLNELRRLVNFLLKEQGKFDTIKVELGRDLKIGKKKRQELSFKNNENNKKNEDAKAVLSEYGLAHSRENVQKYLLWKEIEEKSGTAKCPYTGKTISIADLLGKENKFQIEHIFPKSTSLDDSFVNKTLCDAKFNGLKGNKTPYQFYKENNDTSLWGGARSWDEVKQRAFRLLPYNKAKKFTSEKVEEDTAGFIERQLNDTRYMSKKAKEILSEICDKNNIRVLPGSLTSELRHLWDLNNILEPVETIDFSGVQINEDKAVNHWVIFDENKKVVGMIPIENEKPKANENEIFISGFLNKKAEFSSKYLKTKSIHNELFGDSFEGKYWKKIKLSEKPIEVINVFKDKPEVLENEIILRGKVANKKFENDTLGKKINAQVPDGYYWAKFKVNNVKFEKPVEKTQPQKTGNQILLYGNVYSAVFKSYIFECKSDQDDGKCWAIIDLDTENVIFSNTMNPRPETDDNTILIQGNVNSEGVFSAEIDKDFKFNEDLPEGKYWTIFEIKEESQKLYPFKNTLPQTENKQNLIEGKVWVNKSTAEIKFDPKKNRNDHRHHAIDAITIALTEQSYVQKLSTYNAQMDEKDRGLAEKPYFDEPWDGFYNDVKDAASKIIISHKANNKVLTKINKIIHKNGQKILSKGYAAAGKLHKENVYGKRILHKSEKEQFHIRKSVESLNDNQVKKIVDKRIRLIIENARAAEKVLKKEIDDLTKKMRRTKTQEEDDEIRKIIDEKNIQIKLLFTLPNKNGEPVPIKKVRIQENIGNTVQLKERKVFSEKKKEFVEFNQYVNPRKNHHAAIYEDAEGNLYEKIVTFWEAVERKKTGLPVIDKKPVDGSKFITSLQINDMFLLGIKEENINWTNPNNKLLTKHIFRVQKVSSKDYFFRHHLASTQDNSDQEIRIASFKAWNEANPIKIQIDLLGRIIKV